MAWEHIRGSVEEQYSKTKKRKNVKGIESVSLSAYDRTVGKIPIFSGLWYLYESLKLSKSHMEIYNRTSEHRAVKNLLEEQKYRAKLVEELDSIYRKGTTVNIRVPKMYEPLFLSECKAYTGLKAIRKSELEYTIIVEEVELF